MKEYEETLIIVPSGSTESKVYFISAFDFGGKLPQFLRDKIAVQRLKYLDCIKCYFVDQAQARIYETFRKATEIVKEIKRASQKEIAYLEDSIKALSQDNSDAQNNFAIMDAVEKLSEEDHVPDENSADAGAEIDEASEIQSLNDSYFDLSSTFMKSNPFAADQVTRNTITVRPSYMKKTLISKKIISKTKKDDVEIIVEELNDEDVPDI